jgi:hypothetical protein
LTANREDPPFATTKVTTKERNDVNKRFKDAHDRMKKKCTLTARIAYLGAPKAKKMIEDAAHDRRQDLNAGLGPTISRR